jgi:hypothetical protein
MTNGCSTLTRSARSFVFVPLSTMATSTIPREEMGNATGALQHAQEYWRIDRDFDGDNGAYSAGGAAPE